MFRNALIVLACLRFVAPAFAQEQKLPADIAGLPEEIKSLQWQNVDLATCSPLEQARALLLMDHVISELSANQTAEADLMSSYIEKNKLGADFANTPAPPEGRQLGFSDGMKVAVALLRGPMSQSYYATELGDAPATSLASYATMYQRTCQRKWSEFDEARNQVRVMGSYLGNSGKLQDYDTWAKAESAARQKQYDQRPGAGAAAGAPANQNAPGQAQPAQAQPQAMQSLAQQNMQLQQALAAAESQQQPPPAAPAQAPAPQPQSVGCGAGYAVAPGYVAPPVYGGYAAYGAYGATAAAGASAANAYNDAQRQAAAKGAAAGAYHANNNSWNRDASYSSAARAQTEQRMNNFHGTAGRR